MNIWQSSMVVNSSKLRPDHRFSLQYQTCLISHSDSLWIFLDFCFNSHASTAWAWSWGFEVHEANNQINRPHKVCSNRNDKRKQVIQQQKTNGSVHIFLLEHTWRGVFPISLIKAMSNGQHLHVNKKNHNECVMFPKTKMYNTWACDMIKSIQFELRQELVLCMLSSHTKRALFQWVAALRIFHAAGSLNTFTAYLEDRKDEEGK